MALYVFQLLRCMMTSYKDYTGIHEAPRWGFASEPHWGDISRIMSWKSCGVLTYQTYSMIYSYTTAISCKIATFYTHR